jgi:hypothetical protein
VRNPIPIVFAWLVIGLCFVSQSQAVENYTPRPDPVPPINLDLDCSPLPIPNMPADRDPVGRIYVHLDVDDIGDFRIGVRHTTLSGRQFWRAHQYTQITLHYEGRSSDFDSFWVWRGVLRTRPDVIMVGSNAEVGGMYVYVEQQLNGVPK